MKQSVRILNTVVFLIVIVNLWSISTLAVQYTTYNDLIQKNAIFSIDILDSISQTQTASILQLVLYFLAFSAFCFWFYGAHEDLKSLQAEDLTYHSAQTFSGFFIPIVNLVRPYRIAKETWEKSGGTGSFFILRWWVSSLLGVLCGYVSGVITGSFDSPEAFKYSVLFLIAADAFFVLSALFSVRMVSIIEKKQKQRYDTLGS